MVKIEIPNHTCVVCGATESSSFTMNKAEELVCSNCLCEKSPSLKHEPHWLSRSEVWDKEGPTDIFLCCKHCGISGIVENVREILVPYIEWENGNGEEQNAKV